MAKQDINLGSAPSGAGGDTRRSAFSKCIANFNELYELVVGKLGKSDVVGSVASGAVVERGSNSRGEYTKWADGTMICWFGFVGYTPGVREEAWPAVFVGTPATSCSVQPSSAIDFQWMCWGASNVWGFYAATATNNIVYISGIGRWK